MGSYSDSMESHVTGDTNMGDHEQPDLEQRDKVSHDCLGEGERNKGHKLNPKKTNNSMGNVTISDENHIFIHAINDKTENNKILSEKTSRSQNDSVNEGNNVCDLNNFNDSDRQPKNDHNDDLQGNFVVYEKPDINDYTGSDADSTVIEKSLTLTKCDPNLMSSVPREDGIEMEYSSSKAFEICGESSSLDSHVENRESETDSHSEDVNSNALQEKSPVETYPADEATKQNILKTINSNNGDKNKKREITVTGRFPVTSRTNSKHGNSRSPRQATVLEIDETSEAEDVLNSVERAGQAKSNDGRRNSINHKTPWKHQNKSVGKNKDPIKEDLCADYSHTKNSFVNQEKACLVRPASAHPNKRRLGAPMTSDKVSKPNRCPKVHSFVSNIPHASEQCDPRPLGISFDCTSSTDFSKGDRRRDDGFTSVYQRKYTKLELRKALPRKSFFNCHEKAMKDAGLEIEDPASRRKAERLKAKLERIAKEFGPLPSRVVLETGKEHNTVQSYGNGSDVSILVTDAKSDVVDPNRNEETSPNGAQPESIDINAEDAVDGMLKEDLSTAVQFLSKKKRLHPEKTDYVECKPLVHYLEYIKDNQSEYENYRNTTSNTNSKNKPITRLISLGRAFELRHCGGNPKIRSDDVMVMAAKALRPRSSDASRYYKREQDKSSGLRGQDSSLRQSRPPSDDKRRQEKNASSANATKDEEHAKTELERKKIRAEEWAMSVSTNTLTRAKIQSLRELGSDDDELTKWWVALKRCHYLRVRGLAEESS